MMAMGWRVSAGFITGCVTPAVAGLKVAGAGLRVAVAALAPAVAVFTLAGCGDFLANQTASLGGPIAGGRGVVRMRFVNETEHAAVFTVGTFDQTDRRSQPAVLQVGTGDGDPQLAPNSESGEVSVSCGRTLSLGSPTLLDFVNANADADGLLPGSLIEGVQFFSVSEEDPGATGSLQGSAPPIELLLGVDFECESLVEFRLKPGTDGPESFVVEFEVTESESTRN